MSFSTVYKLFPIAVILKIKIQLLKKFNWSSLGRSLEYVKHVARHYSSDWDNLTFFVFFKFDGKPWTEFNFNCNYSEEDFYFFSPGEKGVFPQDPG